MMDMTYESYDDAHKGFDFRDRNNREILVALDLVIANLCFDNKAEHLVTFKNNAAKIQID